MKGKRKDLQSLSFGDDPRGGPGIESRKIACQGKPGRKKGGLFNLDREPGREAGKRRPCVELTQEQVENRVKC